MLALYGHPFSSYTQKVLIALYENGTPFELLNLDPTEPVSHSADWLRHWPLAKFPVLVDGDRTVVESSIVIEHLQLAHPGPVPLIPADPRAALDVRFMDRFFDLHVTAPVQHAVNAALTGNAERKAEGVAWAAEKLEKAYAWLEGMWAGPPGLRASRSRWPTALRRPRCSMPTGRTPSQPPTRSCAPTVPGCWRAPRLPARWRAGAPTATTFRSGRPTATEQRPPHPQETAMMNPEPHAMHRWLQQLLGDWTCESLADMGPGEPPAHSRGTEQVRALGGLWVLCDGAGSMPGGGGEARMLMTLGYDPDQQAFVGTWVGSMMTHMWVYRGTLDADQKVLTLETEGPSFKADSATMRYRDVITVVSANERTLTSFGQQPDGSWKQFMQAKYTRTS